MDRNTDLKSRTNGKGGGKFKSLEISPYLKWLSQMETVGNSRSEMATNSLLVKVGCSEYAFNSQYVAAIKHPTQIPTINCFNTAQKPRSTSLWTMGKVTECLAIMQMD
ncbi:hypothetical protein TCAL_15620 [Tigriopus californicus]|uniref:Uncharacterized protein n=1 Tax=Tigriopus californicus TaxID=6832 RepID=A0A553PCH6_TIGCA|nr:hypothetical protein TCAL_15620 [Tigriopus californicus]